MSLDELKTARSKAIGTKQTIKALQKGVAEQVFIAEDADRRVTAPVEDLCRAGDVPVTKVATMRELGSACGIQVGAASVAVIK